MRLDLYGYSHDTMKLIYCQLFSNFISKRKNKFIWGWIQIKSLVSVIDVVRCLKFMGEKNDIENEIFHLTNEKMTVNQIAQICKN